MQQTVAQTPMVQQQPVQTSAQPTQIIQIPATPGLPVPANVQTPQGNVRYIKLPPGVTKGTYNLRSTPLNNPMVTKASTTNTVRPLNFYSLNSSFLLNLSGKFENFESMIIDANVKLPS